MLLSCHALYWYYLPIQHPILFVLAPFTNPPLPGLAVRCGGAQLQEAAARTCEIEAQRDAAASALASAEASESQQVELAAAQAEEAHAAEMRQKLAEAEAAAAAAAATKAETAAERVIRDLQERLVGLAEQLKEAEERALAGVGARAEEEEAKARDLQRALDESVAGRAEVQMRRLFFCSYVSDGCGALLKSLSEGKGA